MKPVPSLDPAAGPASVRARAYVGIGSNLDNPLAHVRDAMAALDELPATRVVARASLYRSAPIGKLDQPDFVNSVAALDTTLAPEQLLDELFAIEARHGRARGERNAPRTLDLDLLLYGDRRMHEERLTLPHPRMHERAFVLLPLAELDADAHIPGHGSVRALLAAVSDQRVARMEAR
jgi:2-amino-4-hydroxy-6-hydroxymethyldihydropteridine diphosphokinase